MHAKLKRKVTSFDSLPVIMSVEDVQIVLRISKPNAYKIMSSPDFPRLLIGKRILVRKDDFMTWLDKQNKY